MFVGGHLRTVYIFFLECPLYTNQRRTFIDTIEDDGQDKITILLFGNALLNNALNKNIFIKVTNYIQQSGRSLWNNIVSS